MRLGMLPSQQRALQRTIRKARAFDGFRQRTRRQFLLLGMLASASTLGAFVYGRSSPEPEDGEAEPDRVQDERLALAYRLASRTDAALWEAAPTFLVVLDAHRTDPALWMGFARLARMAAEREDPDSLRLAGRLLKSADAAAPPAFVKPLLAPLRGRRR